MAIARIATAPVVQGCAKGAFRSQIKVLPASRPVSRTWRAAAQADDDQDQDEPPALMGDWRQFRARLVAEGVGVGDGGPAPPSPGGWATRQTPANRRVCMEQHPSLAHEDLWAHPTGIPERGGLVVATSSVPSSSRFWQAVVFLAQHGPDGSIGFMLNRPTALTLGRLPLAGASHGGTGMCAAFKDSRLYCGGFDGQDIVSLMHGDKALGEEGEVVPGIYMGSQASAVQAAAAGTLSGADVRFFAGCVAWGPGELQAQVGEGMWQPAACSRAVVLKNCLALPVPLWVEVQRLMGGAHAEAADAEYPGGEEDLGRR